MIPWRTLLIGVCIGKLITCCVIAQQIPLDSIRTITIRKTALPIQIDGDLSDEAWQYAETAAYFCQSFPYDTSLSITCTEAKILFDDKGIYVAAICKDTFPQPFVVQSLKRDFSITNNDAFVVSFDPLRDQTNGFSFGVTPFGVQREGLIEDRGFFGVSTSWDNKWFAETKRYKDHWTAEMFIPFTSLRYKPEVTTWGINFHRQNLKINEMSNWARVPRNFNISSLPYAGLLKWAEPPPKVGRNIALIPYVTGRFYEDYQAGTRQLLPNAGLNAKVGVSSSLNLDLTINPDFSQVEVDQQITNLSRFSLFFPERREFFIENSDLFARFGFRNIRPFFSRQIGLYAGRTVPILAGARLSGKINSDWRIGLMNMQTEGVPSLQLDPYNYSVAAVQRQLGQKSNLAAIFVNKQNTNPRTNDYNRIAGVDWNFQNRSNTIVGKAFFHHSFSPNQPKDAFAQAVWVHYNTATWSGSYNHEYIGENYDAQVGFVPRTNVIRLEPDIARTFYPQNSILNNIETGLYMDAYFTKQMQWLDRYITYYTNFVFQDGRSIGISYDENYTYLQFPFDPSGTDGLELPEGGYAYRQVSLDANTNPRKVWNASASTSYGSYFNGNLWNVSADFGFRTQPYGNFSFGVDYNRIVLPEPYNTANLLLASAKIELTFSRSLFFTTFLQFNTQTQNFNINSRFQWRFAPMSDLFIVWTDNYNTELLNIKNRALVLKLTYWFNP